LEEAVMRYVRVFVLTGLVAAVFFHIDTVTLNSLIVRPDSAPEPCRRVNYSDMDTVNVWPFLNSTTLEMNTPLTRLSSGAYAV
jgi:hypothetical protein